MIYIHTQERWGFHILTFKGKGSWNDEVQVQLQ